MEPIVALATSPVKSALHIIRISGDNIFEIISTIFSHPLSRKRDVHIGCIKDDKKIIDHVVLITYKEPESYTGEDVIEIITHGNVLIDNEIIRLLLSKGVRMATNGEFTSRAYLHHKMDLVQAEAVNDLINATTLESQQIINYALEGKTSQLLTPIKNRLLDLIANVEINIDYPEYKDVEKVNHIRVNKELTEYKHIISQLIAEGQEGLIIKNGINLAIVGRPNVGKSTLLNALINEDKAIVSSIPGTTRDVVEGDANIAGVQFHILDTAGIRVSNSKIESIGVKKTYETIKKADIIVYVKDKVDEKIAKNIKNKNIIEVINKSDKLSHRDEKHLYISALNRDIAPLIKKIKTIIGLSDAAYKRPSFANARELGLLKRATYQIDDILKENKNGVSSDLLAVLLHELLDTILEIFGEKASLDMTQEIFSRFCVGK